MLFTVETKNLTAGHGVFSTTCPAAGHIDTAFHKFKLLCESK